MINTSCDRCVGLYYYTGSYLVNHSWNHWIIIKFIKVLWRIKVYFIKTSLGLKSNYDASWTNCSIKNGSDTLRSKSATTSLLTSIFCIDKVECFGHLHKAVEPRRGLCTLTAKLPILKIIPYARLAILLLCGLSVSVLLKSENTQ